MLGRIAIHLGNDGGCARRVDAGVLLAKTHGAELVGVYPVDDFFDGYGSVVTQDVHRQLNEQHEAQRESVRTQFLKKAEEAGVKADWRIPRAPVEDALALHARYCDLLIMSKSADGGGVMANLPESVIMSAGRPVLMLPNAGRFESIGERVLYCWDQRREAARAFTDAAPFLKSCRELVVVEVDRDDSARQQNDLHEDDFTNYCTRLGYPKPKRVQRESTDIGVGHIILNTASDSDSDLIVMGAYGHSRMREWVMGGASRTLLSSMTVPVLLSQ